MPTEPASDNLDERVLGRGIALGLPLLTLVAAVGVGIFSGLATAILVLAAGVLLGVVGLLWASLRVLSGDAPLSPEMEALESSAQGVDALASRKKMLLRALKDLDNEKALGKLADDDHEQIAATYRAELKEVLRKIDASLAPFRAQAEDIARRHLAKAGLDDGTNEAAPPEDEPAPARESARDERRICSKCSASNEQDAKFCKGCASPLSAGGQSPGSATDEATSAESGDAESSNSPKEEHVES